MVTGRPDLVPAAAASHRRWARQAVLAPGSDQARAGLGAGLRVVVHAARWVARALVVRLAALAPPAAQVAGLCPALPGWAAKTSARTCISCGRWSASALCST